MAQDKKTREDIKALYAHAEIANQEMGIIKTDISVIKTNINWIKESFDKHTADEIEQFKGLHSKIDTLKLGVAPWVSYFVIPVATALILFFLTHKWA